MYESLKLEFDAKFIQRSNPIIHSSISFEDELKSDILNLEFRDKIDEI